MDFRTTIETPKSNFKLQHGNEILLLGSCFSQNINRKLRYFGFNSENPFGAIYNPLSVRRSLGLLKKGEAYDDSRLFLENGLWHSYDFHSDYSAAGKQVCLDNINACIGRGHGFLRNAKCVFISLGTSFCYRLRTTNQVVANCHKSPAANFERFFLPLEDCVAALKDIVNLCGAAQVVFTVSPIRHVKDGLHANQVSKANLLLAIDRVCAEFGNCSYFPSYEILMDDLRDYRFYAADMTHLSETAVDYIWEVFADTYFDSETKSANKKVDAFRRMQNHKLKNPDSDASKALREKIEATASQLQQAYKGLLL